MATGMLDVHGQNNGDGFGALQPADPADNPPTHYLDTDEGTRILRRLEDWWTEARDQHADSRREQLIDADYYDSIQWRAEDAQVLLERGQAPLTFPIIKQMVDWVIGTERRTRIDWDVLPRADQDVDIAAVKKDVLKWISDVNGAGWERSAQFADAAKVGIGWTEECYNNDKSEEAITVRHQDWKGMWWDPYSRSNVMRDCRYMTRAKWIDLDYAIAMWPDRAAELDKHAIDTLDSPMESLIMESSVPQMFFGAPAPFSSDRTANSGSFNLYGSSSMFRRARKRVLCLETWFKRAVNTPLVLGDSASDLNGLPFDPKNAVMQDALSTGVVSLVDSVTEEMWFALWTPGTLLRLNKSPYKHKRFPFTPTWAYRRHRDGMPYGLIRPARDAQDEYNKRRSKILFDLSTTRVIYETGAMEEADEDRNLEEAKRPDGEIRLAPNGMEKFKIDRALDAMTGQIAMLAESKGNIYEASGVTRENTGQGASSDQSGRAILAKQQQGSVTTAELFDNFRQAIQESGQKTLSNCEKFLSLPKVVRIAGADGAIKFFSINSPQYNHATGDVTWNNDITDSEADFVIDQTDYRETVRMAMAESLFELIGRMPPDVGVQMLDMAVDLTDIPNKQALVNRIRQINGQTAPGLENSPEALRAQQAADAAKQAQEQTATEAQQAKTRLDNARASAAEATARSTTVEGKTQALQTAGMLHALAPLAPAADRLYDPQAAAPAAPIQ
jgi:hypothetical protein